MLMVRTVPQFSSSLHLTPDQIGAIAFGVAAATGVALYIYFHRKPDPAEIERQRRLFLAERGRITDATLIDTGLLESPSLESPSLESPSLESPSQQPPSQQHRAPDTLQYQYRVAGVAYESSQDVAPLADAVRNLRVDLPIQVRYDPHNPGNSIVVAESWSGLRLDD